MEEGGRGRGGSEGGRGRGVSNNHAKSEREAVAPVRFVAVAFRHGKLIRIVAFPSHSSFSVTSLINSSVTIASRLAG